MAEKILYTEVYNSVPIKIPELQAKIKGRLTRIAHEIGEQAQNAIRREWGRKIGSGYRRAMWANWEGPPYMPERVFVDVKVGKDTYGLHVRGEGKDILAIEYGVPEQRHVLFGERKWKGRRGFEGKAVLRNGARKWAEKLRNKIQEELAVLVSTGA